MTGFTIYSQVTYSLTVPISIGLFLCTDFFEIIINQSIFTGGTSRAAFTWTHQYKSESDTGQGWRK